MMKMSKVFLLTAICTCSLTFSACASSCSKPQYLQPGKPETEEPIDTVAKPQPDEGDSDLAPAPRHTCFNIVGVDHFGRSFGTVDAFKKDRTVGMFYWPWIGQPYARGIYDATKIAAMPNGIKTLFSADPNDYNASVSPDGQAHYWGEPIWGYYNSIDEWVIRKQMEMITLAGVDFIFFDHTNAIIYPEVLLEVCKVIDQMLKEGWAAPKIVSYTHSKSLDTVRWIYRDFYQKNLYPDTWFKVDGKPLIIAYTDPADDRAEAASRSDYSYNPDPLSSEILNFFHFFKPNWPFDPTYENGFTWVEWKYPQPYHSESRMMNVTVASHPGCPMSFSLTRPGWINWGRGWNPALKQNISEDVDKGTFFQLQWDRAIESDPPIVSVGGWNEWIAYKQIFDGEYMLCDAASKEFSRDIEPMVGGYQDAFYLQLASNIRRYKGVRDENAGKEDPKTIDIKGSVAQWQDVNYVETKPDAEQMARDAFGGSQTVKYQQPAPKDALLEVRVAHDKDNLYFYIKTKARVSDLSKGSNKLNIFLGTGEPTLKGWNGYEYLIGSSISEEKISIDALSDSYGLTSVGEGAINCVANLIQLSVPRSAIGLANADKFYFKVAMGVEKPSDIMNYYTTGSSMPMGRLSYEYYMNK